MSELKIQIDLEDRIKTSQSSDVFVKEMQNCIEQGRTQDFSFLETGFLRFRGRMYVPLESRVRGEILEEAHKSRYTIHSRATKMYQDLKKISGGLG